MKSKATKQASKRKPRLWYNFPTTSQREAWRDGYDIRRLEEKGAQWRITIAAMILAGTLPGTLSKQTVKQVAARALAIADELLRQGKRNRSIHSKRATL